MDTQRIVLFFIFGFSVLMLWDAWEKEHRPRPVAQVTVPAAVPGPAAKPGAQPATAPAAPRAPEGTVPGAATPAAKGETVVVRTDLVIAEIDTLGATLKRVELLKHKDAKDSAQNLVLLGPEHQYEAQSGLTGDGGPNHRTLWRMEPGGTTLEAGQPALEVRFIAQGKDGLAVTKLYRFVRGSYEIEVSLELKNTGSAPVSPATYFQLTHDGKTSADANAVAETFGAQSFNGFAVYTEEQKFQKVQLSDVDKGKADYVKQATDGWLAYIQHYFVAGWIPPAKASRSSEVLKRDDGVYAGYVRLPAGTLEPGAATVVKVPLYAGPQEQQRLAAVAPGFDLVVDYGWLTIIAWPLFWLLEKYHLLSGNWGVAIILLTVTIKLVFFPLSAASYRSMAKMKLVTPRLTKLREQYGDDRAKLNQAMMEMYKTEKVNPLGGCLPIVIQIPVFISLYWVLLAAVELRHAPFFGWIKDLAAADPFYVLPVIMGATMFLQTKLNPTPPDPIQAKVMLYMPIVFSFMFLWFPAGLVLYWTVNNLLSIWQQWQINRMTEQAAAKKGNAKR